MSNFLTASLAIAQSPLIIFIVSVTILMIVGTLVLGWWINRPIR